MFGDYVDLAIDGVFVLLDGIAGLTGDGDYTSEVVVLMAIVPLFPNLPQPLRKSLSRSWFPTNWNKLIAVSSDSTAFKPIALDLAIQEHYVCS